MLLATFALLFDLLLLLELLGDPGLAQRLALAALVGLRVEGRLQGGVPTHADHHLLPELQGEGGGRGGNWKLRISASAHERGDAVT